MGQPVINKAVTTSVQFPLFSLPPIHKLFGADNNSLKSSGLLRQSLMLSLPSSFHVFNVYFLFCKCQHFIIFIILGIVFVKYFISINVFTKVMLGFNGCLIIYKQYIILEMYIKLEMVVGNLCTVSVLAKFIPF